MHVRPWHARAEGKCKIHEILVQSDEPLHPRDHVSFVLADGVRVLGNSVFIAGDPLGGEGRDGKSVERDAAFVPAAGPHWVLNQLRVRK